LFYFTGASPAALAIAFLSIMSGLGSVWRFVLTENSVTRIQLLWAARLRDRRDASPALPHPSIPVLRGVEVPSPDLTPPQRLRAERKR
jgi:hypothetical protein